MPGPYFMCSYYFSTIDNEGWSENFFISGGDITTAASTAAGYIAPRMACSPDNVDMVYGKVSDTSIKGDSKLMVPATGNFPFIGTYTADPVGGYLEANTALLIMIVADPTKRNRFFLRGLSLDVVTGREFKNPPAFTTALTALTTWLSANVVVRTANKPVTKPPVYTYAVATDAFFQKVTARKPGRPFLLPRGRKFAHRLVLPTAVSVATPSVQPIQPRPVSPQVRHP